MSHPPRLTSRWAAPSAAFNQESPGKFVQPVLCVIVTTRDFAALFRRHLVAVLGVLAVAAGLAFAFKTTPTTYMEGGTVVFNQPVSRAQPNPYFSGGGTLIMAGGVVATYMTGDQGHQAVAAAGGSTAGGTDYDVSLVNSYNQEYPNYSTPEANATVTGTDLVAVERTYTAMMHVLTNYLADQQASAGAPAVDQITAQMIGNPGPLAEPGSSKRVFGGLLLLTLIAVFAVCVFLDRHPVRLLTRAAPDARRSPRSPGMAGGGEI